jgi:replicative superfamily II helicase
LASVAWGLESKVRTAEQTDASVSVGLAAFPGLTSDKLIVLLLACESLCSAGEFARTKEIARLLPDAAEPLRKARPYLQTAIEAVSSIAIGQRPRARFLLSSRLGLSNIESENILVQDINESTLGDLFLCYAMREWLLRTDGDHLSAARSYALEIGDGLLLAIASFVCRYATTSEGADPRNVVTENSEVFTKQELRKYLESREISTLFPAQIEALKDGLLGDSNCVLSMPTSSGKTFLAELCIANLFGKQESDEELKRTIYIAPYRLLSRQVQTELRTGLHRLGVQVQDLGSNFDFSFDEIAALSELPEVAIMTPERLDAIIRLSNSDRRGSSSAQAFLDSVSQVIVDETQIVGRINRGPRLELILARLRQRLPFARFIFLAASGSDASKLAEWLEAVNISPASGRPTGLQEVLWAPDGKLFLREGEKKFEIGRIERHATAITAAAQLVIGIRSTQYPVLIVETTRDNAENVIRRISELDPMEGQRWRNAIGPDQRISLDQVADLTESALGPQNLLSIVLRQGLAFHHAGLPSSILRELENLVQKKAIRAIGAMTTVAEGADLPFKVVVIPHLNFGQQGEVLDRELYRNIVGRAGRANVAIEGIVVILGSGSQTLQNHVEQELWNERPRQIKGQLLNVFSNADSMQIYRSRREVESQILAWLGDEGSYMSDQAEGLVSSLFSGHTSTDTQVEALTQAVKATIETLEDNGLAMAASPYQLTDSGKRARLGGVSFKSSLRIRSRIESMSFDVFTELEALFRIDTTAAAIISNLVFECEEVIENSLWFRRQNIAARMQALFIKRLMNGEIDWPYDNSIYQDDLAIFEGWILGRPFTELANIPPVFSDRGAFGSDDAVKRTIDALEHTGRITYSAAWAWSAVGAMLGGEIAPAAWIRSAIENGVPTEAGTRLIEDYGVSRETAVKLSDALANDYQGLRSHLEDVTAMELIEMRVPDHDRRLLGF